ncbi:Rhodanese-like domain containing protein [Trichomonas vaginalis G3]|uniref:Rhodanese-like domain containing protein n=1 Tax=Trichomonas vaginalis (strain ATCC PRA-98 / G3) TaxID=412133 RepID=A2FAT7_TRIV3|nr:protein polyglutamylation [Trichomonas vaginalis G3]EAX97966.1 Rhodanese-like domain containing protein [Trichomonas vaginalis G3]KAI5502585.1 protein polyglutamylation [Trichomonas vaginalis G3]|eukprot:XP_001310896.1 Rhodanese-like domain containing protein [Trichomonas vaginalis G3]
MTIPKLITQLKNKLPKDEIFRRIRPKRLMELLGLYAFELHQLEMQEKAAGQGPAPEDDGPTPKYHHMHSSVVFNDTPAPAQAPLKPKIDCPFLLLDVRDEEEFEKCHIQGAKLYPKARLSRATNQFTPEILQYKAHPEKMIIVYCDYGKTSAEAAHMLAERGFDNIFLLHEGLAAFADEFPNLVGPNPPPPPLTPSKKNTAQVSAASKVSTAVVRGVHPHATKRDPNEKKPWK